MIERYSLEPMKTIWSEKEKFKRWLKVEVAAAEAMGKLGIIPQEAAMEIKARASFDVEEIKEREKITKHDVAAFVDVVANKIGEAGKYLHYGMTSYDVVDTALSMGMKDALKIIIKKLETLADTLKELAIKYKYTPQMGRTHGIHAEPITFGLKLLVYYREVLRNIDRAKRAMNTISVGKISGAVGTFSQLPPEVEEIALKKLGLRPAKASTQILQRDRHIEVLYVLATCGTTLEKIATEIRHLQRTEVREVEEPFSGGQKGSSAMPHKRNPVRSERICGLARLIRGYLSSELENNALWHERDISHSSVERIIIPDAFLALDFILSESIDILKNLKIKAENMLENIWGYYGLFLSQRVLLALVEKGWSRDSAYRKVQSLAHRAIEEKRDFRDLVKHELSDELPQAEELFSLDYYFRHIDRIFERALKD